MLKECIQKLLRKENLSVVNIESALKEIITKNNEAQTAAFLTLLRAKGETAEEIYGFVKTMKSMMLVSNVSHKVLDIVGTGGDGFNTVNISTGSALLAASCGVKIAKHGNRSVSSMSGSADVLDCLGINIDISPSEILECIESANFGFFYAPNFHPALSKVKLIRKKLGLPTAFNLVGPLLNPAQAQFLMVGVSDPTYLNIIADVLLKLDVERAMVFNCSGLDEICCVGSIEMVEIYQASKHKYIFDPIDYGFERCTIKSLQGGSAEENSEILKYSLKGNPGAISDTLVLNAGLANYMYGLCDTKEEGISMAREVHLSGAAYKLLDKLIAKTESMLKFSEASHA